MILTLAKPLFLLLIPAGVLVVWRLLKQKSRIGFSSLRLFEAKAVPLRLIYKLLFVAVVAVASIALAEPMEQIKISTPVYRDARDIVLVLDVSGSMKQYVKMKTAKEVIGNFVAGRPQDRIGLYSFTTAAYLEWPLSFDHNALLKRLSDLKAAGGTRISEGFISGLEHLSRFGEEGKGAIIIVSDGVSHVNDKDAASIDDLIQKTEAKVYWIWIGKLDDVTALEFKGLVERLGGIVYMGGPGDLEQIFTEISRLEASRVVYEYRISAVHKFGSTLILLVLFLSVAAVVEFASEV